MKSNWVTITATAEEVKLMGEIRDSIDGAIDAIEDATDDPSIRSEGVIRDLGGAIGILLGVLMQIDDATGGKYAAKEHRDDQ